MSFVANRIISVRSTFLINDLFWYNLQYNIVKSEIIDMLNPLLADLANTMYMLLFYLLSRQHIFCLFLNYVPRSKENEQTMIYKTMHRKLKRKPYKNRCELRCSVRASMSWSTSEYIEICHCLLYFWYSSYECPFPVCAMQRDIRTRRYSVPPCFDNATLLELIRQLWSDLNEQRLVRSMFQQNKPRR